jgi:hypothetical protein
MCWRGGSAELERTRLPLSGISGLVALLHVVVQTEIYSILKSMRVPLSLPAAVTLDRAIHHSPTQASIVEVLIFKGRSPLSSSVSVYSVSPI